MNLKEKCIIVREKVTPKALAIAGGVAVGIATGGYLLYYLYAKHKAKKIDEALNDIEEALVEEFGGEHIEFVTEDTCGFTVKDVLEAIEFVKESGEEAKMFKQYNDRSLIRLHVILGGEDVATSYMDMVTDEGWDNPLWDKTTVCGKGYPKTINYLFFAKVDDTNWITVLMQGVNLTPEMEKDFEGSLEFATTALTSEYPHVFKKDEEMKAADSGK